MKLVSDKIKEIESRPRTDDYIEDLLPDSPASYMLIVGRPSIGKTFLALNLMYCLASGKPFLGFKTKQCNVGYLSFEGAEAKISARFKTISQQFPNCNGNVSWEHTLGFRLNNDSYYKLGEIVTGQDVVIIDTLRYLIPGDYTKPSDAQPFLDRLIKAQNEFSTRFILLHHIRKPERKVKIYPEDLMFEVKGAGEYVEGATTVLLLEYAKQLKDSQGKFLQQTPDNKILYFTKVKDSPLVLEPKIIHFDRKTMLFEPITSLYNEDEHLL